MMAEWMLRAVVASLLVGVAALAVEEIVRLVRHPRRGVWAVAMVGSLLLPGLMRWIPLPWSGPPWVRGDAPWHAWLTQANPGLPATPSILLLGVFLATYRVLWRARRTALVVMPWNPVLWWQHRRLRRAVETDCNARVLARGADVGAYGRILLETTRRGGGVPVLGLAFSKPVYLLERRILAMTDRPPRHRHLRLALLAPAAALLVAAACELSAPNVLEPEPAFAEKGDTSGPQSAYLERRGDGGDLDEPSGQFIFHNEVPIVVRPGQDGRDQPLFFVDGDRVDPGALRLRELNPDEIVRIEVVSSAAAERIEGAAAAGGIVHITTRAAAN